MKISNLRKNYEHFALNIESMEIRPGRVYGIIGQNGCGKTTAMKLLAGLTPPDSGSLDYEGLTPRDITMVFRKPYILNDTVVNNLVYPLKLRGITPHNGELDHYLELAELAGHREAYAPGLSGGQQQKLALVRALIFSPKLIFIDEAFSNMDIESVAKFENYILHRQTTHPTTWVIISHQLSNIKRLCSYIYFMYNGSVDAHGAAEKILSSPENANLRRYLQHEGM
ncbi:MAG: ABC transporter ATP-binding protein [Defluviitaleaceae bacterium]|nr:ABC transporter ATP-binding protein [Defluviitaleaceae bacterium]